MSLSFSCHACGAQRELDESGAAPPCPECGAGLPGSDGGDSDGGDSNNGGSEEAADETDSGAEAYDEEAVDAPPVQQPPEEPPIQDVDDDEDDDDDEELESFGFLEKKDKIEGDMDMTPMVDVTFLLLIFFMVTAAFSLQKSIEIPKPADNQASTQVIEKEEEDDQTITVIIDQFNTFRVLTADIEEEAPGKHDLLRRLRRLLDEATPGSVPNKLLVKAHGEATHERVVIALDVGAEVGMEQVQLMTIEEDL